MYVVCDVVIFLLWYFLYKVLKIWCLKFTMWYKLLGLSKTIWWSDNPMIWSDIRFEITIWIGYPIRKFGYRIQIRMSMFVDSNIRYFKYPIGKFSTHSHWYRISNISIIRFQYWMSDIEYRISSRIGSDIEYQIS